MYKDKGKQKEANKERQRRYRDKQKGVTSEGVTDKALQLEDLPCVIPHFGQPDCQCRHCQNKRAAGGMLTINHGPLKTRAELATSEVNRVSLPGDPDYNPSKLNELCTICGDELPQLEQPRKYPGKCLKCVA